VHHGQVQYRVGRSSFTVRAGQAIVIPAGVTHTTTFMGEVQATALGIGADMLRDVCDAMAAPAIALEAGLIDAAEDIVTLGDVTVAGRGHVMASQALAEALTIALLRTARARVIGGVSRDARICAALDRIQTEYSQPLAVEDLARCAGMSRFGFTRQFRAQTGSAPYQYLLSTRLDRAAERLRSGSCSVTEVAFAVGFTDLGRFGRMFRRRFGCSPSEMAGRARSV
jgi:AraC-like DNA-binding protein